MSLIINKVDTKLHIKLENDKDKSLFVEQYKLLIDYIKSTKSMRTSLNSTYLSISLAVVPVISFIYNFNISELNKYIFVCILSLIGFILCLMWSYNLRRMYRISQVLDAMVIEMETFMPVNLFSAEQEVLKATDSPVKTEKQEMYLPQLLSLCFIIITSITVLKALGYI